MTRGTLRPRLFGLVGVAAALALGVSACGGGNINNGTGGTGSTVAITDAYDAPQLESDFRERLVGQPAQGVAKDGHVLAGLDAAQLDVPVVQSRLVGVEDRRRAHVNRAGHPPGG